MSDRDIVVSAAGLTKVYRLYARPHHRFLDMFGLLNKPGAYTEHKALSNINLDVARGEKVAFIGRNGAGKSTLLKLITGVIEPTSGELKVSPGVRALLQIGSGFHQDFTGRQNALAYLSHLGISGEEAADTLAEVVDFSELEEYIDQPIKTYSTGMVARLMFATSTVIKPELLVLDEILGVGDAYFAHKSFERIREMCEGMGMTVLLVSHDIYSAAKLCERMVWIDKGQITFDGSARDAIVAYETSVREQEEKRLRAKKFMTLTGRRTTARESTDGLLPLIIELQAAEPMNGPVYFESISLSLPGQWEVELPLTEADAFSETRESYLLDGDTNWADMPATIDGRLCREMQVYGAPFNKVAGLAHVPAIGHEAEGELLVRCTYKSVAGVPLRVSCFNKLGHQILGGELPPTGDRWQSGYRVTEQGIEARRPSQATGTNRVQILDARLVNSEGREVFLIGHGEPMRLFIDYRINDLELREYSQVAAAFHRDGSVETCRFMTRDLYFDGSTNPTGTIEFLWPRMLLSEGRYTISLKIAEEGYYDRQQTKYFTINPGVYCVKSRMLEIQVTDNTTLSAGTVFVGEAEWDILPDKGVDGSQLVNERNLPLNLRHLLQKAAHLAEFKDVTFCPGWESGYDQSRGGRFVAERRAVFESLQAFEDVPPVDFEWIDGLRLRLVLRGDVARALFVGGSYDPNELSVLKAIIEPGMTVVDAGAHMGIYSVYLAHLVGERGKVLSVEPSAREVESLERNIKINRLHNVAVHRVGLGDSRRIGTLNVADASLSGHNSFAPLQALPVIRSTIGGRAPRWEGAWNGAREFICDSPGNVEFWIYSECDFDYVITGLQTCSPCETESFLENETSGETHGQPENHESADAGREETVRRVEDLFPGWQVEWSEDLEIEIDDNLRVHGRGGDYICFRRKFDASQGRRIKLSGHGLPAAGCAVERVNLEKLDDLLAMEGNGAVDFIKLDVEGYEAEALEGAASSISKHRPFLMLEAAYSQRPDNFKRFMEFLNQFEYKVYEFDAASGKLSELDGVPQSPNIFAAHVGVTEALAPVIAD